MQNYAYAVDAKDDNASRQWQKQIIDLRKIASTPVSAKHGLLSLPGLEKVEKVMREMNKMCTKNTAPHATRVQSDRGAVSLPPVVRYLESQFALEFDSGLRAVPVRESGML